MIDRKLFFDEIRKGLFGGTLTQGQVDGIDAILDEWDARKPGGDFRWLAYMLATTFHETARTMQPIEEYGKGAGHAYGIPDAQTGQTYYGRGYVQLTWKANYQRLGQVVGVDLVNDPARALDPRVAAAILFEGMEHGLFTGRGLSTFFNASANDPKGARKIINGTDRDDLVASYYEAFLKALHAASTCGAA